MTSQIVDELYAHLKAQPFYILAKPLFLLFNQNASPWAKKRFWWRTAKNRQGFLAIYRVFSF